MTRANTKVYALPEGWRPPRPAAIPEAEYPAAAEAFTAGLRGWLSDVGYHGDLAGEVATWRDAGGEARYMVMSLQPLALMFLPLYQAHRMPARFELGLTVAGVREAVARQQAAGRRAARGREQADAS